MQAQMQGPVSDVMILDNMGDEVGESNTVSVSNLDTGSLFQFTISEMAKVPHSSSKPVKPRSMSPGTFNCPRPPHLQP